MRDQQIRIGAGAQARRVVDRISERRPLEQDRVDVFVRETFQNGVDLALPQQFRCDLRMRLAGQLRTDVRRPVDRVPGRREPSIDQAGQIFSGTGVQYLLRRGPEAGPRRRLFAQNGREAVDQTTMSQVRLTSTVA